MQHNNEEDKQILTAYEQGLEPLPELDLETALKILQDAGYTCTTVGNTRTFVHPDYELDIIYKTDQDVLDAAQGMLVAEQAMKETLREALPALDDEELTDLAKEASEHW